MRFSLRKKVRPNPSLERTSTGIALGPRGARCHHAPRGPSAMPAAARSAQTLGRIGNAMRMLESSSLRSKCSVLCIAKRSESSGTSGSRVFVESSATSIATFGVLRARNRRSFLAEHAARSGRPSVGGRLTGGCARERNASCLHLFVELVDARKAKCKASSPRSFSQGGSASTQSIARRAQARMRPNPSLERTSTGVALGPRSARCHHPLRGPSTTPVAAAQLKR